MIGDYRPFIHVFLGIRICLVKPQVKKIHRKYAISSVAQFNDVVVARMNGLLAACCDGYNKKLR
jgi:hypothetical protein